MSIPVVAEVRSLSQPLGKPPVPDKDKTFLQRLADQAMRAAADSRYVSTNPLDKADLNHITRFDIVFRSDPFSPSSLDSLEDVRQVLTTATHPGEPLHGSGEIGLAGSTSAVNDLKNVTTSDQQRMYILVTLGVYAILVALLRRPGICLYLILTVVLGYLASLGVTELVFRSLHHGTEPWGGLDWTVGFFLFVILVAVGEDYNILLMARVIEEEEKHGITEGTRLAVAHTGGIISSCGLIMAGTFGSMLTGTLTSLRELGFALCLGILLDTFLVRPVLVPAFVVVMDRFRAARRARRLTASRPSPMRNPTSTPSLATRPTASETAIASSAPRPSITAWVSSTKSCDSRQSTATAPKRSDRKRPTWSGTVITLSSGTAFMSQSRILRVSILVLGTFLVMARFSAAASDQSTTVYRDEFGIPHIFAPTIEDASFAAGYTQAEDRLEELLKNYRRASGTMAEVFGPAAFQDDLRQRAMRHAEISEARYGEISPKLRAVIASYQDGIRRFMKDHPDQVPAWAQEIRPWDVVALGRHIIWNWPMGEAAGDLERVGVGFGPLTYRGSNEMLIGPRRTAMNAPIAIIDPHVQWYDAMRFYEVRIYTPEYSASGVAILGMPLPTLGHSRYCSIAMTTGGPDTSDIFEEEVNPANPSQYRYDGNWRDFTIRKVTIGVKNAESVERREISLAYSHHGPIVAQKNGKAYAMALPYENEVGLTDQCYQMMTARNLGEMKAALSHLQLMAQNIMVSTVQGDIYYLRNGRVPIRPDGVNSSRPIPGNTSANEWKGIHSMSDLVQIENPPCGWMQNCNCSPAAMMNHDQPPEPGTPSICTSITSRLRRTRISTPRW